MWLIPILLLGAIAIAAASKSPREAPSSSRQIAAPVAAGGPPGLPGPIAVLGEILRVGQYPSPTVILCAIAEAEAIGRRDLASNIVSVFVAPVVYQHQLANVRRAPVPFAPPMPGAVAAYERGSCALPLPRSPRAQADARASCAPRGGRGSCAPPAPAAPLSPSVPQVAARQPTEDELITMLHADPAAFVSMVESQRARRGPLVEIFPIGTRPPTGATETPPPSASSPAVPAPSPPPTQPSTANADAFAEQLLQVPGHAGSGVTLVDPSTNAEIFEVRWLRGYPVPPLPQMIDGRPVRLVVVDALPVAQPTGLPPETVAQMEEATGLPEVADRTRSLAPGSPLAGVSDEGWRQFVMRLARESPTYSSSRHVGQYRQRRERLAELGIDPRAIYGSATAQRAALDADLADAHRRLVETGDLQTHLGRQIAVPGTDTMHTATLSGILGVVQCAGLDGAVGWLERSSDRRRYPHTTQAFLHTNGAF